MNSSTVGLEQFQLGTVLGPGGQQICGERIATKAHTSDKGRLWQVGLVALDE